MKALVLGGNGFIGSHFVDQLLLYGYEVRVLDIEHERFREPLSNVDYRIGSFNDIDFLDKSLNEIDIVFHLIGTMVPALSSKDPVRDVEENLIGTIRLLRLMHVKEIKKIIYFSSGGTVYGIPNKLPIPETHPLNPICSYGVIKVAIENYIRMCNHLNKLEFLIIRPSNPYGPRQGYTNFQGVIATFLWHLAKAQPIEIWGDGKVVRDFIYVSDLVEKSMSLVKMNATGIYNIGSGNGNSILEVIDLIKKIIKVDVSPLYSAGRPYDVLYSVLDISALHELISELPFTDIHVGVLKTWEWINTNV